jgi:hypothetical protein
VHFTLQYRPRGGELNERTPALLLTSNTAQKCKKNNQNIHLEMNGHNAYQTMQKINIKTSAEVPIQYKTKI